MRRTVHSGCIHKMLLGKELNQTPTRKIDSFYYFTDLHNKIHVGATLGCRLHNDLSEGAIAAPWSRRLCCILN